MEFATVPLALVFSILALILVVFITGHIVIPLMIYFLPWLIALVRGHHSAGGIFVLNLLLGWTLVGWLVALVWSFAPVRRYRYA